MGKQVARKGALKRTVAGKRFFNVSEDYEIWTALHNKNGKPISTVSKEVSEKLKRSFESVRDRIKRYIQLLGDKEAVKLKAAAKATPNYFVHFKVRGDARDIEEISQNFPSGVYFKGTKKVAKNRKNSSQKQSESKVPEGKMPTLPDKKLEWVREKLASKDTFFKVDFGIQLVVAILNALIMNEGVSQAQVEEYVSNVQTNQSLDDLLGYFRIQKE